MAEKMATKHLSLNPQIIDQRVWYYEQSAGIDIVYEIYDEKGYLRTDAFLIPWSKLRKSLKRKDKKHETITKSSSKAKK